MKKNRKGFTLAELLIVVAVIGVLVAIAIPVFNTQLRKARLAANQANARAAYAAASAAFLFQDDLKIFGNGGQRQYASYVYDMAKGSGEFITSGSGKWNTADEDYIDFDKTYRASGNIVQNDKFIDQWTISDTGDKKRNCLSDKVYKNWKIDLAMTSSNKYEGGTLIAICWE